MSRTSHHRVRNTLNSVSLALTRLQRKATGTPLESEIKVISQHIQAFAVIHNFLAEGESDGDVVDLGSTLLMWCREGQSPLSCEADLRDKIVISATDVASILQLTAEIRNAAGSDLEKLSLINSGSNTALNFEFKIGNSSTLRNISPSREIFFEALLNALSDQSANEVREQLISSPSLLIILSKLTGLKLVLN